MTDYKLTSDGKKRMQTMVSTSDGFKIAEVDLQLRGPGETQGTRQSGALEFRLGNLAKDEALIKMVRKNVTDLLELDNRLQHPDNRCALLQYEKLFKKKFDWGMIG